jgi:hypothetical protein
MTSWDEPPMFGSHGESPPVQTEPVLLSESYTVRIAPAPRPIPSPISVLASSETLSDPEMVAAREWVSDNYSRKEITRLLRRALLTSTGRVYARSSIFYLPALLVDSLTSEGREKIFRDVTLFRLRTYFYWQREDPLIRLTSGASGKITRKIVIGLSAAASREITSSFGAEVSLPGGAGKISGQEAVKEAITLTRSEQHEESRELTLPSPETGSRRYAIWQRPFELTIDGLRIRDGDLIWTEIASEVFNRTAALVVTSDADVMSPDEVS